jgi:hypothetical protein
MLWAHCAERLPSSPSVINSSTWCRLSWNTNEIEHGSPVCICSSATYQTVLRYALAVLSLRRLSHALRRLPGHTSVLQQTTKRQESSAIERQLYLTYSICFALCSVILRAVTHTNWAHPYLIECQTRAPFYRTVQVAAQLRDVTFIDLSPNFKVTAKYKR